MCTLTVQTRHNGYQYRCMVTDADGNDDISSPATLALPQTLSLGSSTVTFHYGRRVYYLFTPAESGEYREDNIYPMYFGLLPRGSEFRQTDKLKSVGARRDEYYRLKSLCLAGGGEEALRQILLGETSSPEAALCVFVEDILGVNPKVIGGEVWLSRLGEELGNVSVRVKAFGHKALYTRKDGFATLKL